MSQNGSLYGCIDGNQTGRCSQLAARLLQVAEVEDAGQYFMAAIALGFALETALLTYMLVELSDEIGGELEIPEPVNMAELIKAANYIDVLNAPIDIPSHATDENPCREVGGEAEQEGRPGEERPKRHRKRRARRLRRSSRPRRQ